MKEIPIRIWPEIIDYLPALTFTKNISKRKNELFLDFSNCLKINSAGLNILLIHLIKLIECANFRRSWHIDPSLNNPIMDNIEKLGFFKLLEIYSSNSSFFELNNKIIEPVINKDDVDICIHFPIYFLDFNKHENRRNELDIFKDYLIRTFNKYSNYKILFNQLITILNEMGKNSADHTNENAFFGLDITINKITKIMNLKYSFGDLGDGIKIHIEKNLPDEIKVRRKKHWSLYESYFFAFQTGYTSSKDSFLNKGLGMTFILDAAKGINSSLSVFDANSLGLLSAINQNTHSELRRNFINIGKNIGFYYYGSLKAESK